MRMRMRMRMLIVMVCTGVCAAQDMYLYRLRPLKGGLKNEVAALGGNVTTLDDIGAMDDGAGEKVPLGFSFPVLGQARVKQVAVSPNGLVGVRKATRWSHPCKRVSIFGCPGFVLETDSIAVLATDLWPGPREEQDQPLEGAISIARGTSHLSVLWESRRLYNYQASLPYLTEDEPVTVGLTLFDDGRVTMYYEQLPDIRLNHHWKFGSLWAGVRGPSEFDTSDYIGKLSANDRRLQQTWNLSNMGLLAADPRPGFMFQREHITNGSVVEMCMVGDIDLHTLDVSPVCLTQAQVTRDGTQALQLRGPTHLFGCLRAGIDLRCVFADSSLDSGVFSSLATFDIEAGPDTVVCELPPGLLGSEDLNSVDLNITLVYEGSASSEQDRVVATQLCGAVGGPTLAYLTEEDACPPDPLLGDQPGIRDCNGECEGTASLDNQGNCCVSPSEIDCRGTCVSTNQTQYSLAAAPLFSNGVSFASNQLQCCSALRIDCTNTCGGCRECFDDGSSSCPQSTSAPTVMLDEGPGSLSISTLFGLILSAFVGGLTLRALCFTVFSDNSWIALTLERVYMQPEGLSPDAIEKHTRTFEYHAAAKANTDAPAGANSDTDAENEARDVLAVTPKAKTISGRKSAKHLQIKGQKIIVATSPGPSLARDNGERDEESDDAASGEDDDSEEVTATGRAKEGNFIEPGLHLEEDMCPVCLANFVELDLCKELPCHHVFHSECISTWLGRSVLCPMCKFDVRETHGELPKERDSVQEQL